MGTVDKIGSWLVILGVIAARLFGERLGLGEIPGDILALPGVLLTRMVYVAKAKAIGANDD
jgi:hypothetical protein